MAATGELLRTRGAIARLLGVSAATVRRWERLYGLPATRQGPRGELVAVRARVLHWHAQFCRQNNLHDDNGGKMNTTKSPLRSGEVDVAGVADMFEISEATVLRLHREHGLPLFRRSDHEPVRFRSQSEPTEPLIAQRVAIAAWWHAFLNSTEASVGMVSSRDHVARSQMIARVQAERHERREQRERASAG